MSRRHKIECVFKQWSEWNFGMDDLEHARLALGWDKGPQWWVP